jgi:hypothetical protein
MAWLLGWFGKRFAMPWKLVMSSVGLFALSRNAAQLIAAIEFAVCFRLPMTVACVARHAVRWDGNYEQMFYRMVCCDGSLLGLQRI